MLKLQTEINLTNFIFNYLRLTLNCGVHKKVLFLFLWGISAACFAQTCPLYRIYFKDKGDISQIKPEQFLSAKSIDRRKNQGIAIDFTDYPICSIYLNALKKLRVKIVASSKWLNYVLAEMNEQQLKQTKELFFIRNISPVCEPYHSAIVRSHSAYDFDVDYSRISIYRQQLRITFNDVLNAHDYRGQGKLICLMDDGYLNIHQIPAFRHLFMENKILGTYDFVDNDPHVFDAGGHGTMVLSNIAAIYPQKLYGGAYDAQFLLTRTEDISSESRREEDNWAMAAEWADSIGADIFSTSLGYSKGMTDSLENYVYSEMDGNTTIITRAADLAATKGILVINSAGNEGNSAWKYISAPADGDSVLTVGAVDSLGVRSSFSSFGPTADGRLKPEVVTLGSKSTVVGTDGNIYRVNGTSFSCPLMSALAASLWSSKPQATAWQIREALIQSAHQYSAPDTALGYGIPDARKAFYLLHGYYLREPVDSALLEPIGIELMPNPVQDKLRIVIENRYRFTQIKLLLTSVHGQATLEKTFPLITDYQEKKIDVDVAGITAGMYYAELFNEREELLYKGKLVITR